MENLNKNIYKSYINLLSFFEYRKYLGVERNRKTFEEFSELFDENDSDFYTLKVQLDIDHPGDIIIYFFSNEISIVILEKLLIDIKRHTSAYGHFVIVHGRQLASKAKEKLDDFVVKSPDLKVEKFLYSEVNIDITKNINNPKFELLDSNMASSVIQSYTLESKDRIPSILNSTIYTDPMVKVLGAKRGDIIRIIRQTEHETIDYEAKSIYYRHVV